MSVVHFPTYWQRNLKLILEDVNNHLRSEKGVNYNLVHGYRAPKEPVNLELHYDNGPSRRIGIIHLVHLKGKNWDEKPADELARTVEEIKNAIFARIQLFYESEKNPEMFIDETGTIFDFGKVHVCIKENSTFLVEGNVVKWQNKPLLITQLKSESVISFQKRENGHVELQDSLDQREKKRVFIDEKGKIYRA